MAIIEASGLARTFRSRGRTVEAVRGVDLKVERGEIVGFLGPNGAGKTTTVRMLATLIRPTSGTATVAGGDLLKDPAGCAGGSATWRRGSGGTEPSCTVGEELRNRPSCTASTGSRPARAEQLTKQLDLTGLEDRPVKTLSGGQRRRLDVALGLIHQPAAGVPRRADVRAGPAEPPQHVGPHPPAARRAVHDGVPDDALPGRGRRPLRPDPGDRPRPDRRGGLAGGSEAADLR